MSSLSVTPENLEHGSFTIKSLEEAKTLGQYLGQACPNPHAATLGITELLFNAIEHGNLGIGFEEKSKLQANQSWLEEIEARLKLAHNSDKVVTVTFNKTPTAITIDITDCGQGFNWHAKHTSNNQESHGRGILLAKELAFTSLQYNEKGNSVRCTIKLNNGK